MFAGPLNGIEGQECWHGGNLMAGMRQFRVASPAKHCTTASVPLREELYGRLLGKNIETIFGLAVIRVRKY